MDDIPDIIGPHYKKIGLLLRILRRIGKSKWIQAARQAAILESVHRLHFDTIHQIRRFSLTGCYKGVLKENSPYEPFLQLANGLRNTMAKSLAVHETNLHCTIKLCRGEKTEKKEDWKVYTIARSLPYRRPGEFGPEIHHKIGENSSFASLCGCNDTRNNWQPNIFSCFSCGDLTKYPHYACTRKNWQDYFRSTLVLPLRYREGREREFTILGYLTFDSEKTNIFYKLPNTFDYMHEPCEFHEEIEKSYVYHIGGIMADLLATTFALQENI